MNPQKMRYQNEIPNNGFWKRKKMCKKKHIKFTTEESAHKHMTYRMNDNLTFLFSKCLSYPRCYKQQAIL